MSLNSEKCVHGIDRRFCSICNRGSGTSTVSRVTAPGVTLAEVIAFLNSARVRATYGAVGEVIGVLPRAVGMALGDRRIEASWVVNAETGWPTDYAQSDLHPDLFADAHVITTGRELLLRLAAWKHGRAKGSAT